MPRRSPLTTWLAQAAMGLITVFAAALIWLSVVPDRRAPVLDGRPLLDAPLAASPARR